MNLFSRNLRFLRKKGNHNQEDISGLFNKRANTIGNWENQKSEPSLTELIRLGEYFHVSVQDLLHTDMAGELNSGFVKPIEQKFTTTPPNIQAGQDPALITPGGAQDAFWLLLKELRIMNEKLDAIKEAVPFSSNPIINDKSSH